MIVIDPITVCLYPYSDDKIAKLKLPKNKLIIGCANNFPGQDVFTSGCVSLHAKKEPQYNPPNGEQHG